MSYLSWRVPCGEWGKRKSSFLQRFWRFVFQPCRADSFLHRPDSVNLKMENILNLLDSIFSYCTCRTYKCSHDLIAGPGPPMCTQLPCGVYWPVAAPECEMPQVSVLCIPQPWSQCPFKHSAGLRTGISQWSDYSNHKIHADTNWRSELPCPFAGPSPPCPLRECKCWWQWEWSSGIWRWDFGCVSSPSIGAMPSHTMCRCCWSYQWSLMCMFACIIHESVNIVNQVFSILQFSVCHKCMLCSLRYNIFRLFGSAFFRSVSYQFLPANWITLVNITASCYFREQEPAKKFLKAIFSVSDGTNADAFFSSSKRSKCACKPDLKFQLTLFLLHLCTGKDHLLILFLFLFLNLLTPKLLFFYFVFCCTLLEDCITNHPDINE